MTRLMDYRHRHLVALTELSMFRYTLEGRTLPTEVGV